MTAPHDDQSRTRGFLFADLRDYTGYVEAHGDHAGAALLGRYRALVRAAVAATHGAEIKTEGDSFYVVFDSTSAAVRCGQEIIAAADASDPADPIRVGVGVHAGETVETAEGFVGSAVNIAARIGAQAGAGELIVSDTVRALTRTQLSVEFEPLGSRHLKGVNEQIAIFRVVPRDESSGQPRRQRVGERRPTWLPGAAIGVVAGIVAVAVIVLAAAGAGSLLGGSRSPAPSSSLATASPSPATLSDAATATALVRTFKNALEVKDWGTAWSLLATGPLLPETYDQFVQEMDSPVPLSAGVFHYFVEPATRDPSVLAAWVYSSLEDDLRRQADPTRAYIVLVDLADRPGASASIEVYAVAPLKADGSWRIWRVH